MLDPLVHEALPASCTVQPELVVLTVGLVALQEGYESLAVQVSVPQQPLDLRCTCHSCPTGINDARTLRVRMSCACNRSYTAHCSHSLAGAGQQQHPECSNKAPATVSVSLGVRPPQMGSLGEANTGPCRVGSCPMYGSHMGRAWKWCAVRH